MSDLIDVTQLFTEAACKYELSTIIKFNHILDCFGGNLDKLPERRLWLRFGYCLWEASGMQRTASDVFQIEVLPTKWVLYDRDMRKCAIAEGDDLRSENVLDFIIGVLAKMNGVLSNAKLVDDVYRQLTTTRDANDLSFNNECNRIIQKGLGARC